MAVFPRTHNRINSLCTMLISGYQSHPEIFINSAPEKLAQAQEEFRQAAERLQNAQAEAKLAADQKQKTLQKLEKLMRTQIKQSEVDTTDNPDQLEFIGWGRRKDKRLSQLPSSPAELKMTASGNDFVCLNWQRPADNPIVNYYKIESLAIKDGRQVQDWQLAATSIDTSVRIEGLSADCQYAFRVRAVNSAGTGIDSNTIQTN